MAERVGAHEAQAKDAAFFDDAWIEAQAEYFAATADYQAALARAPLAAATAPAQP